MNYVIMCIVKGGVKVADVEAKRLQITLMPEVAERLDKLAQEMGLKRSAVLAVLINEKWKEEHTDEK